MTFNAISANKANRLYWLGRYTERVYLSLHFLRRYYDQMIDGHPQNYEEFYEKLDAAVNYRSEEHTSELQSHSDHSYAVFCLKKKNNQTYRSTLLDHTVKLLPNIYDFCMPCSY